MKLVVVSALGAAHRHVVAEVAARHPIALVLKPFRPRPAEPPEDRVRVLAEKLARWRDDPLAKLREGFEQRVREARMEVLEAALRRILFDGRTRAVDAEAIPVGELHAPATLDRLRALEPDLMIVCGAPILRPPLFSIPRFGAVNVHYGISPDYRGEDTLFWALVREDYDRLGVTLHYLDKGVDTGRVIARGYCARRGGDTEAELWASAAGLGARLLDRFLSALPAGPLPGELQPPGGRQYFRRERTALWDARYLLMRALGKTPPPAEERIEGL